MLVAVRYLGNDTITGINQIEDWYLPAGAFKTRFVDAAGRVLYLVGTPEQIRKEDSRLDKKGATLHHFGHTYTYKGVDERKSVSSHIVHHKTLVTTTETVVAPPEKVSDNV